MTDLFQQRVRRHQRRMQRYLKYVFSSSSKYCNAFFIGSGIPPPNAHKEPISKVLNFQ